MSIENPRGLELNRRRFIAISKFITNPNLIDRLISYFDRLNWSHKGTAYFEVAQEDLKTLQPLILNKILTVHGSSESFIYIENTAGFKDLLNVLPGFISFIKENTSNNHKYQNN